MEKERRLGPALSATLIVLMMATSLGVAWPGGAWPARDVGSALLRLILASAATQLFTWLILFYAPRFLNRGREEGFRRSIPVYDMTWITLTAMFCVIQACLMARTLGIPVAMHSVNALTAGLLFVVIGNTLGKLSPNGAIGIRTPWTRRSFWVWDRTHRTCGPLMVLLGTAFLVMGLLARPSQILQIALVLSFAALAYGISWHYARIEARRS